MSRRRRAASSPSPSPPSWLTALKPQQLKALSWHYAILAKGTPSHPTRCIDPRKLKRADLHAHIRTNLADVVQPSEAALRDMVVVLKALSDAEVISALAAEAGRGRSGRRSAAAAHSDEQSDSSASESSHSSRHRSALRSNRRESRARSPPPSSTSSRKRHRSPSESPPRGSEEDSSSSSDSRGSRASDDHNSDSDTPSRTHRRSTSTKRRRPLWMACSTPECEGVARQDRIPDYCDKCGKAWRKATTPTSSAAPQRWKRLDRFVYTPLASLTAAPLRATQLASLPDSVVKKAREGQQHYTIADLLCPLAHDGTFSSALLDEQSLVILADSAGTITTRSGSAASEVRSLGTRKRTISSFDQIAEVFMFTLIPVIYEGRPDIGEQLYRLLSAALDISRAHDWRLALQYINLVRHNYWMDPGVRAKHVLNINTTFDLGAYDASTFLIAQTAMPPRHSSPAPSSGGTSQRTASGGKPQVCNDWNRDACTRTACKFAHRCASCGGTHSQTRCTRGSAQQGSQGPRSSTPRHTPAAPSASAGTT